MGGKQLERQIETTVAYIFGGLEERLDGTARLLGTTPDVIATILGGLLLKMGNGSADTMSSVFGVSAGQTEVRLPEMAVVERPSSRTQSVQRRKDAPLVACPQCGKKVQNLGTHTYMKHKGGAKKLYWNKHGVRRGK